MRRRFVVALLLLSAPVSSAGATQIVASQAAGEESVKSFIGAKVLNANGESVGDIDYLLMGADGTVKTAIIGVGGFLGIAAKDVGVAFSDIKPQINRDGTTSYLLNMTKDELQAAPAFKWTSPVIPSQSTTSD
jgi:hypothetical protein